MIPRRETDEEVRGNLSAEEVHLFNRMRRQIRGTAHMSRTEAFREYLRQHPKEDVLEIDRVAEWKLKQHLRPMLDFYETPSWAVRAIVPYLPVTEGTRILDAGCGSGAILREIGAQFPENEVVGLEKDGARFAACLESTDLDVRQGDFFTHEEKYDIVISNPPYSHALQFVQHALTRAPFVCMLLRLPWLASMHRAAWHREHPCHVCVLPRRPSFTADGKTDATEYAWFVWGTGNDWRYTILDVEKRVRK